MPLANKTVILLLLLLIIFLIIILKEEEEEEEVEEYGEQYNRYSKRESATSLAFCLLMFLYLLDSLVHAKNILNEFFKI
jgi:uncharacterized membrane protein